MCRGILWCIYAAFALHLRRLYYAFTLHLLTMHLQCMYTAFKQLHYYAVLYHAFAMHLIIPCTYDDAFTIQNLLVMHLPLKCITYYYYPCTCHGLTVPCIYHSFTMHLPCAYLALTMQLPGCRKLTMRFMPSPCAGRALLGHALDLNPLGVHERS